MCSFVVSKHMPRRVWHNSVFRDPDFRREIVGLFSVGDRTRCRAAQQLGSSAHVAAVCFFLDLEAAARTQARAGAPEEGRTPGSSPRAGGAPKATKRSRKRAKKYGPGHQKIDMATGWRTDLAIPEMYQKTKGISQAAFGGTKQRRARPGTIF